MTEEEFRDFMIGINPDPERVNSICKYTETLFLTALWKSQGYSLTSEEFYKKAKELRKEVALSISLVASGIATPQDVIHDLK